MTDNTKGRLWVRLMKRHRVERDALIECEHEEAEEALRELSGSFDCAQLSRVVDNVLRGLRFGSSITDSLEEAAQQSRAAYRTALEERVAKAPVKMMLPTGTLILPAMLLLVMGPILLELAGGF